MALLLALQILTCEGHERWVRCVAFSPDGATIASGGDDSTLRFWDPAAGAELHRFKVGS